MDKIIPSTKQYDSEMDTECISLCNAVNRLPGMHTTESCCGHNKTPFNIWFVSKELKHLPTLLYWFMPCHCSFSGWRVLVTTDCAMSPVHFCIQGPVGAYREADKIAELIEGHIKNG